MALFATIDPPLMYQRNFINLRVRHYSRKMSRSNVVVVSLLLTVGLCGAQTGRDNEPYCQNAPKKVDITDADAIIHGLRIGHSSLEDVQQKFGRADIERVSREEESDVSVCYISPIDQTILVFYSGAMGGWKDVTWFGIWSHEAAFPHASQCASSTLVSQKIATDSGLRLGLTKKEVAAIAGRPTKVGPTASKYEYLCLQKMTEEQVKGFKANNWDVTKDPYLDRMSWINVRYANYAASRLEVGRIESY